MKTVTHPVSLINAMPHEDTAILVKTLRGPYSQRELATSLGTNQQQVSDWEAGRTRPNPTNLRLLLLHMIRWRTEQHLGDALANALTLAGLKKYLTGDFVHDR